MTMSHLQKMGHDASLIVGSEYVTTIPGKDDRLKVEPKSTAQITELVKLAVQNDIGIQPMGNARRVSPQDALSKTPCFILDLRRLNQVLHLDSESKTVRVQTGLRASELEAILQKRNLTLGDFPTTTLRSTIGGLLSVRTPGKSSRRHGTIEDSVVGLTAILANGQTVHTRIAPKRASGPDLARALCGSEGTLGIITEATLKMYHKPETELVAAWSFSSFTDALQAVRLALREEAAPSVCCVYDKSEMSHFIDTKQFDDSTAFIAAVTSGQTDLATCDRELIESASTVMQGTRLDDEVSQTWWSVYSQNDDSKPQIPPTLQLSATPGRQDGVYDAIKQTSLEKNVNCTIHASQFDFDGAVFYINVFDQKGALFSPNKAEVIHLAVSASKAGAFLPGSLAPNMGPSLHQLKTQLDPQRVLTLGSFDESRS